VQGVPEELKLQDTSVVLVVLAAHKVEILTQKWAELMAVGAWAAHYITTITTVMGLAMAELIAAMAVVALSVLFGPEIPAVSHQQTQVICNGTLYSYC
jgi:type III secretory pathway lipoprotein EscJ